MHSGKRHIARNVLGAVWKDKFTGIQVPKKTNDGASLAASTDFIASCWESGGGGTVCVIGVDQIGERRQKQCFFRGHTGAIQDIQFCPFYSAIFATASEDSTVKLWDCGSMWSSEEEPRQDPVATLKGHDKRVCFSVFNHVAEWVLATGAIDCTARVWDLEVQAPILTQSFSSHPVGMRWDASASLLAVATKAREICIWDPRGQAFVTEPIQAHEGAKPVRLEWSSGSRGIGDHYVISTGFSKTAERQLRLWDTRRMSTHVAEAELDRSAAILQPYFDPGTGLLLLHGKGNRNILFYGLESDDFIKFGAFESLDSWKDFAIAPKRGVDVMKCEVLRGYGSLDGGYIQPVSLCVPRRNMSEFQEELFPPCFAGEPAVTTEEWFGGQTAAPILASMSPVNGISPFAPKRPRDVRRLEFSRERTAIRETSSVLKKALSVTTQNLGSRVKELETIIEDQSEVIQGQSETIRKQDNKLSRLTKELATTKTLLEEKDRLLASS
ncbi:coronin, partial [Gregarina niphandrodes]